jgi:hypothetical protein
VKSGLAKSPKEFDNKILQIMFVTTSCADCKPVEVFTDTGGETYDLWACKFCCCKLLGQ